MTRTIQHSKLPALILGILVMSCATATAQEFSAALSVTVNDSSGAAIPHATVILRALQRDLKKTDETNIRGISSFESLLPGDYSLEISRQDFDTERISLIRLAVRDRQSLVVQLKIAAATASVSVTDRAEGVATDASSGVSVDHDYIQHLPVNGRNVQNLVLLAPGITSAAGDRGGGFNANGQRSNTNYYLVDGVSASSGGAQGGPAGAGPGGPLRGGGGIAPIGGGAGDSLISMDAMQEMRVQTSSFAPEFGRSPGAQISITSRGGTNQFHGGGSYYFRNERLGSNDWFANSRGFERGVLRQNRPAATLGGRIIKDRTFFFVSAEENRLVAPSVLITSVPDLQSRLSAPSASRVFLNAFPIPNGPQQDNGAAEYHAILANPSRTDLGSLRLDHTLTSRMTMFARYSITPSTSTARGGLFSPANVVSHQKSQSHSGTIGWTLVQEFGTIHDIRVNYSLNSSASASFMDGYDGAKPLEESRVFPKGVTSATGHFSLNILGAGGYSIGGTPANDQQQWNVVHNASRTVGSHTFKIGEDYRRIAPTTYRTPYTQSVTFNGFGGAKGGVASGVATTAQTASNLAAIYPVYTNFSFYAQDTWRATDRTTLTYGLRWDLNPAPGVRSGPAPLAVSETVGQLTQNDPLYQTRWLDVSPRIGVAYLINNTAGHELMFHGGFGIFHDIGYGVTAGSFGGAPYANVRTISLAQFPLASADAAPPVLPPTTPYGQVTAADRNLQSPLSLQWHFSLDSNIGRAQVLSVAYVGNQGRRLLRTESQPSFSDQYSILMLATNGATSDYHGLQAQYRRRLSGNLQTQVSYTYGHSIDSSSNDIGGGFASLFGGGQRGASDFDIRHNINWSGTYRLWAGGRSLLRRVFGDWNADWLFSGRTSLPFDVQSVTSDTSDSSAGSGSAINLRGGLFAQVRPDYTGAPVWLPDPTAPGGRRLNPAAFAIPDGYSQGDLGRNSLRGFGFSQLDLSLRRQIRIAEGVRLNFAAQAYNIFNHPAFANPTSIGTANLSSPTFGLATRTLGGSVGGFGGSIYQSGGPRSLELAVRITF